MKHFIITGLLLTSLAQAEVTKQDIANGYSTLAYTNYSDALATAEVLNQKIKTLVKTPSEDALEAAKASWIAARPSYQQSEVFRFSNDIVDDWQTRLNSWPLDEGLIDYVDAHSYAYELGNDGGAANVIAVERIGDMDVKRLNAKTLLKLNEFGGSEANVATGYHAIEFLLWGQDLHGFEAGAGERPWTDYAKGDDCTNGHCDRRRQYLKAASQLLVDDLEYMVDQWSPSGEYRETLASLEPDVILNKMLFSMGSLALGELAGERIKVALTANSFEDEHDCFSDNSHNSNYYNAKGIANMYYGVYTDHNGVKTTVIGLRDYIAANSQATLLQEADAAFEKTEATFTQIVDRAEAGEAFDQMIAPGNKEAHELLSEAIDDLVAQTAVIEKMATAFNLGQLSADNAGHSF